MKGFDRLQPFVQLLYFTAVLVLAMFVMHPVVQVILFVGAIVCFSMIKTPGDTIRLLIGMIPVFAFIALINPLFSHQGVTILAYFKSGNPLTLESIYYGLLSAGMLVTTIIWFYCMSLVMTSDKLLAVCGRAFPTLSLIFSMVLRFVPRFKRQADRCQNAREGIGIEEKGQSVFVKMRNTFQVFLTMTTWSLENAVDTADVMQARGYGMRCRSHFNRYAWRMHDIIFGVLTLAGILYWLGLLSQGKMRFYVYPNVYMQSIDSYGVIGIMILLFYITLPICMEIGDRIRWYNLKRKI